ncbi:hypothetical protein BCR39DRAFT_277635 [Naematelia encephala]|uniref:ER membrane protein complex subunit 7 beta-sandwich domain-containing protein n=1 Tax=Naematelia encephala TaxID=71784 RepID=A0A1Y2ATL1_9TREE|nr:hypothetical protein BCR39DRAFT_277635 [Naematelia encephala]
MRSFAYIAALLSLSLPLIRAIDISGSLMLDAFQNISTISPSSRIILDNGAKSAFITLDGSFTLYGISPGEHILTPHVPGYTFIPLFLTIPTSATPTPHVQPYAPNRLPLATTLPSLPYPLEIRPVAREDYYTAPPGLNILGLLKNPMVLMMLFSGLMMWGMPMLTKQLESDPELAAEVAATRKRMQGMQNMDWTGSLSKALAGTEETPAINSGSGSSTPSRGANSNRGKRGKGGR